MFKLFLQWLYTSDYEYVIILIKNWPKWNNHSCVIFFKLLACHFALQKNSTAVTAKESIGKENVIELANAFFTFSMSLISQYHIIIYASNDLFSTNFGAQMTIQCIWTLPESLSNTKPGFQFSSESHNNKGKADLRIYKSKWNIEHKLQCLIPFKTLGKIIFYLTNGR